MSSAMDDLMFAVVNRKISEGEFYRGVAEHEEWMVEAQPLAGGGALPMISDDGGLGTVRLFTDRAAVERWTDTLPDGRPRPFLTLVGADLLGPMPDAVQHVVFNAGGPLTLRVLPDRLPGLREISTAVRVERRLKTPAEDFGELAQTLFLHKGYRLVVETDGQVPRERGHALVFTASDAADAYRRSRPDGAALEVERVPPTKLFARVAAMPGIEGIIFNWSGPGPALGLRTSTVEALAQVIFVP